MGHHSLEIPRTQGVAPLRNHLAYRRFFSHYRDIKMLLDLTHRDRERDNQTKDSSWWLIRPCSIFRALERWHFGFGLFIASSWSKRAVRMTNAIRADPIFLFRRTDPRLQSRGKTLIRDKHWQSNVNPWIFPSPFTFFMMNHLYDYFLLLHKKRVKSFPLWLAFFLCQAVAKIKQGSYQLIIADAIITSR